MHNMFVYTGNNCSKIHTDYSISVYLWSVLLCLWSNDVYRVNDKQVISTERPEAKYKFQRGV